MEPGKSLIKEFVEGGWIIPLIGSGAMFARLLTTKNNGNLVDCIKKIATAALASTIAWFVLEQTDLGSLYKAITYGVIGVVSPEVISGVVKLAQSFSRNPSKFLPYKSDDK